MAEAKRFAVVSGANMGIGFGIVRQLASQGITVVLTARDESKGLDALRRIKEPGGLLSGEVLFHKLDVVDSSSVSSLAEFVKSQLGRLDILVNNAGIGGAEVDSSALRASPRAAGGTGGAEVDWNKNLTQTYECAVSCLQINYYGAKRMIEAFLPLLRLSPSPRIVNVSSEMGKLKNIPSEWAKGILSDANDLTKERVDEVLDEFLKDFKEENLKAKGW